MLIQRHAYSASCLLSVMLTQRHAYSASYEHQAAFWRSEVKCGRGEVCSSERSRYKEGAIDNNSI